MLRKTLFACLLCAVVVLAAGPARGDDDLRVNLPKYRSRLTAEETAWLENAVREAYPRALGRVVAFWGEEKARRVFKNFTVAVRDEDWAKPGSGGRSQAWGFKPHSSYTKITRGPQSITIYALPLVQGRGNLEDTLVHEMTHVVHESRYSFEEFSAMPSRVKESLAVAAEGDVEERVRLQVNNGPHITSRDAMKDNKTLRDYCFVLGFTREYGEEAFREVVKGSFAGKDFEKVFRDATGDDWKTVKKKSGKALATYVDERIAAEPDFEAIFKDYKDKKYAEAIEAARAYMAERPDSFWTLALNWVLGRSLENTRQYDDAIAVFERFLNGELGDNYYSSSAAYRIIVCHAKAGRCDEAKAKQKELGRFHPRIWKHWGDDLEKVYGKHCSNPDADGESESVAPVEDGTAGDSGGD